MKKLLSAVLALAMVGAVMATPAFAEGKVNDVIFSTEDIFVSGRNGDQQMLLWGVKEGRNASEAVQNGVFLLPDTVNGEVVDGIGSDAFRYSIVEGVQSISFPKQATIIGANAFKGFISSNEGQLVSLDVIEVPATVRSIMGGAFSGAGVDKILIRGESYAFVKAGTFQSCGMTTLIELPGSVTMIEENAFKGCARLETIRYNGTVNQWQSILRETTGNEIITQGCVTIQCTDGVIEGNHTWVEDTANNRSGTCVANGSKAYKCAKCETIKYERTTDIPKDPNNHVSERTEQVTKEPTVTEPGEKQILCKGCGKVLDTVEIPKLISQVFTYEEGDTGVVLTGVESGHALDEAKQGTVLMLPDTINGKPVTMIGENAFAKKTVEGITEIHFPQQVHTIAQSAFAQFTVTKDGNPVAIDTIQLPSSVTGLGHSTFYQMKVKTIDLSQTRIAFLPPAVTGGCTDLEILKLPATVTNNPNTSWIGTNQCVNGTKFRTIVYGGNKATWENIRISADGNELLTNRCVDVQCNDGTIAATHDNQEETVTQVATCGQAGTKITTCKVCNIIVKTEEIPATGRHQWNDGMVTEEPTMQYTGIKTFTCIVCHTKQQATLPKLEHYTVMNGAGQKVEKGGTATFRFNIPFAHFHELRMDGQVVDPAHYTAWEGSTYVRLNSSYLAGLSNGSHTMTAVDDNGVTVDAVFTVQTPAAPESEHPEIAEAIANGTWGVPDPTPAPTATAAPAATAASVRTRSSIPQTADESAPALALVLMLVSLLGMAGVTMHRRHQ